MFEWLILFIILEAVVKFYVIRNFNLLF